jgi:RNA polymerase sigma factor (sigma-70 family)
MDHYRSEARDRVDGNPGLPLVDRRKRNRGEAYAERPQPLDKLIERERREHLRTHLANLAEPYRDVIKLRLFAELSIRETARVMKRSEGAVKMLYMRAIQQMKREMGAASAAPRS